MDDRTRAKLLDKVTCLAGSQARAYLVLSIRDDGTSVVGIFSEPGPTSWRRPITLASVRNVEGYEEAEEALLVWAEIYLPPKMAASLRRR